MTKEPCPWCSFPVETLGATTEEMCNCYFWCGSSSCRARPETEEPMNGEQERVCALCGRPEVTGFGVDGRGYVFPTHTGDTGIAFQDHQFVPKEGP